MCDLQTFELNGYEFYQGNQAKTDELLTQPDIPSAERVTVYINLYFQLALLSCGKFSASSCKVAMINQVIKTFLL